MSETDVIERRRFLLGELQRIGAGRAINHRALSAEWRAARQLNQHQTTGGSMSTNDESSGVVRDATDEELSLFIERCRRMEFFATQEIAKETVEDTVERMRPGLARYADPHSLAALTAIVDYCENTLPRESWGSPEAFTAWLRGES